MRRYVDFSGRSSRSEFWLYVLFYIIIYIIAAILDALLIGRGAGNVGILTSIVALAHIIPSIAVSVRRLHDIDRTGWWLLVFYLAPLAIMIVGALIAGGSVLAMMAGGGDTTATAGGLAGLGAAFLIVVLLSLVIWIVALVFYCTAGTPGPNRFGPPQT
jgi:uncharacterized membrane protein YhaH (DUF805 family)